MATADFDRPEPLPPMGFIAVEVKIHRPPGDPFNEKTWPFPLLRETAPGSTESQIVTSDKYDSDFIDRFVETGKRLADRGCVGLLTSCGFLCNAQPELSARLPIPIATSSLLQLPSVLSLLPANKSVGVITYNGDNLGQKHLESLGIIHYAPRIHIRGPPADGPLRKLMVGLGPYIHAQVEAELVEVAIGLLKDYPDIGAFVLECTQMPPFAEAIQKAVGNIPVYDVYTMATWFYSGLVRRRPKRWGNIDT